MCSFKLKFFFFSTVPFLRLQIIICGTCLSFNSQYQRKNFLFLRKKDVHKQTGMGEQALSSVYCSEDRGPFCQFLCWPVVNPLWVCGAAFLVEQSREAWQGIWEVLGNYWTKCPKQHPPKLPTNCIWPRWRDTKKLGLLLAFSGCHLS